jgi:hypothetical protein
MGYRMSYMICKMVVAAKRGADDEKKSAKKPDSFTWNYSTECSTRVGQTATGARGPAPRNVEQVSSGAFT